jgi:hypothetical protein
MTISKQIVALTATIAELEAQLATLKALQQQVLRRPGRRG